MTLALRTFGQAAYLSLCEFFQVYTPLGYVISWIPRVGLQLAFFYWLGSFVGGSGLGAFMAIGTAAQMCAHATLVFAGQGVARELASGTLVLMIATRASPMVVLFGRSLAMAGNGFLTAAIGLVLSLPVLGVPPDAGRLFGSIPILVVIALTSYGIALLVASLMLRYPSYQNAVSNLVASVMIVVSGVVVPVHVLPEPAQVLSNALPFTFGLEALRSLLGGAAPLEILRPLALALAGGAVYFMLAWVSFAVFLNRARDRGTLDFH